MDVTVGPQRRLSAEELMLSNCDVGKRDTDVQNRLLDSVGEGEGGMFRENSMYIIYSETDHQPRWDA